MVDKHLAKAVVDVAVFLEFSDSGVVNEDSAVAMLEQIASELQCMEISEQESIAFHFKELADQYGDKKEFVEGLSDMLGIA
ncbi:hypothetical protein [Ralstonia pseudosolanacearum]|uniref:Uncharacterized protein n=1 Tax=Ralstonia solanacearum TaxID=305 RepID=A0AA92IG94_RALSL|nr:hypothetical protein [Ralstonia pseudosolanacearum]QCX51633.1 hypothetical protein E7Z57_21655 [Ralstonia pseudosolanacearum]